MSQRGLLSVAARAVAQARAHVASALAPLVCAASAASGGRLHGAVSGMLAIGTANRGKEALAWSRGPTEGTLGTPCSCILCAGGIVGQLGTPCTLWCACGRRTGNALITIVFIGVGTTVTAVMTYAA